jgi:hypothetical protein
MLEACYVWLVDVGRTSLSRGFATNLAAACLQQRLTPYSLACRQAHAVEGDGHGVRDSTVLSACAECLTPKGSLSVPQNNLCGHDLKAFPQFLPCLKNMGFLEVIL